MIFISKNEKETKKFAIKFAKQIKSKTLICLYGDLGSGKTTFSKFLCKALGVKQDVLSPTFVLERIYKAKKFLIHHYDLYRLNDLNQLEDLLILENLEKGDVCLIEWPEISEKILPKSRINIKIEKINDNSRKFIIEGLI